MKMTALIPMLPVKQLARSVEFYCGRLGFQVETRRDDWGWAMLRFDVVRTLLFLSFGVCRMTWLFVDTGTPVGPEASDVAKVGIGRTSSATVGRSSSVMKRRSAETTGFTSSTTPSTTYWITGLAMLDACAISTS